MSIINSTQLFFIWIHLLKFNVSINIFMKRKIIVDGKTV